MVAKKLKPTFACPLHLKCTPDMGMILWGESPLWEYLEIQT